MSTLGQDIAGTLGKQITEAGGVRTTDLDNQGAYVRTFSIVPEGGQGAPRGVGGGVARCLVGNKGQRWDGETENFVVNALDRQAGGPNDNSAQAGHLVGSEHGSTVRRLTPVECERLMSWPDGWTAVDGDATPDGRRYAACGDGVVSNVAEWIGRRIAAVDQEREEAA